MTRNSSVNVNLLEEFIYWVEGSSASRLDRRSELVKNRLTSIPSLFQSIKTKFHFVYISNSSLGNTT